MKYTMQHQLGFSLVEIMIGMTLGLFLTTGIIQLYIGSNRNYRFQDAFAITQENGRFALELLNNSIRMTNFTGCSTNGTNVTNALNNNAEWWANVTQNWNGMLRGYDGKDDFPGLAFGSNSGNRIKVPDELEDQKTPDAIISLGGIGSYSVKTVNSDLNTLELEQIRKVNRGNIEKGDILWICNATNVVLFQVTDINGNTISNNSADFSVFSSNSNTDYPTEVTEYVPTAFYIGVSTSKASRSLFQMQLEVTNAGVASMQAEEMVEGVENMQIFYGEDTNSDRIADRYVDTSGVTNWASVVSVRIELLMASIENDVISEKQTYLFPNDTGDSAITGRSVTANDKRWYQTFSTTIGIRNRLN